MATIIMEVIWLVLRGSIVLKWGTAITIEVDLKLKAKMIAVSVYTGRIKYKKHLKV